LEFGIDNQSVFICTIRFIRVLKMPQALHLRKICEYQRKKQSEVNSKQIERMKLIGTDCISHLSVFIFTIRFIRVRINRQTTLALLFTFLPGPVYLTV